MPSDRNPTQSAPTPASSKGGTNDAKSTAMLIGVQDAAEALSISPRTLWGLTNSGAVPSITIGRRRLYRPDHLSAWLDAGAPTEPGSAARIVGKGVGQ